MEHQVAAYLIYLPVVVVMTTLVAQTLFKNSKVFMLDIFKGRETIAVSTNNLFKIGFYLLNLGVAFLIMEMDPMGGKVQMLEALSFKVGGFTIYLGIMLFLNLYMFFRGKRKSKITGANGPGRARPHAEPAV